MTRKLLLASLLSFASAAGAADQATDLGKLYAEFWEENLKLNPVTATFAGDPRYNGELPNFLSQEYEEQDARVPPEVSRPRARHRRRRVSPGRTGCRTRSSRSTASRRSRSSSFPTGCCRSTSSTTSPTHCAQLGSGTSAQPFVTVKDYDDWLTRAARAPVIFEQAIVNMREGMKAGLVAAARAHGEGAAAARRQRRR